MPTAVNLSSVNDEHLAADVYAKVEPELLALAPDAVATVNLHVPSAVATVLGCLPEILKLRPEAEKHLHDFDCSRFDKLETYCIALSHTHARQRVAADAADDLPELNTEATATRDRLFADTQPLIQRGLIHPDALNNYKGIVGYKNVASELQLVVAVLRDAWPRIQGKCAIQAEELDRADKLAMRMLRLAGLREQAPEVRAQASTNRARAFTLFVQCYDQVRRAVTYLRWDEDDADEIAPSLYAGRIRKAPLEREEPAEQPQEPSAPVAPPAGATPVAGGAVPGAVPTPTNDGPYMR